MINLIAAVHPDLTLYDFKKIIFKGIQGLFDTDNFQKPITSRTLFSWIKCSIDKYADARLNYSDALTPPMIIPHFDRKELTGRIISAKTEKDALTHTKCAKSPYNKPNITNT